MVRKQSAIIMLLLVLIMIFFLQSFKADAKNVKQSITYEGEDYSVEIIYGPKAGIPESAYLQVEELMQGTVEFERHLTETQAFAASEIDGEVQSARFFNVCIVNEDEEIEPLDTVQVTLNYKDGMQKKEEESLSVVHFVENGEKEILEITDEVEEGEGITEISFEQDSFSVIGVIVFDGIDSSINAGNSETISEMDEIVVEKEWSDGISAHVSDEVEVTLYEVSQGGETACDRMILSKENGWKAKFTGLDKTKKYCLRETKITSSDKDKTVTYKSTITHSDVKRWCPDKKNEFVDGQQILLTVGNSPKYVLRKSSDYSNMAIKLYKIATQPNSTYGEYCTSNVTGILIWKVFRDETANAWNLYTENGNAYLTLSYNVEKNVYEWSASRKKTEGSALEFRNGTICATVNGVKKYLGVMVDGPYEGLDEGDIRITKFTVYTYKMIEPVTCHILNEKNISEKESDISAEVITSKTIDYLGDGKSNPYTDVHVKEAFKEDLKDLYRLNLDIKMQTDRTGLDLLLVMDVSSSMKGNKDAKDAKGNLITRSEALRQALNQFVPSFLSEEGKNNLSIVAFEEDAMILQEWTKNPQEVLEKVNYTNEGEMPLYNGEGTNYEAALIRAHEALASCGKTGNAKAIIFLSDGEPTMYFSGNDDPEPGNVTQYMGEAKLSEKGIQGTLPSGWLAVWENNLNEAETAADEAITSFQKYHSDIMVGTIAFHTRISDSLKKLATDSKFITRIENGTPDDLLRAMELIVEYVPAEVVVKDELSDNVKLYEKYPDFKIFSTEENGDEKKLFSTKEGLTDEGKNVLDNHRPVEVIGNIIRMRFHETYPVRNNVTYSLSFNVNASQNAFDKYADEKGTYNDVGDENSDAKDNDTSSKKGGFYSNGDNTKVEYTINGAKNSRNFRKPVIQVREGALSVTKQTLSKDAPIEGAEYTLYRKAEKEEKNTVSIKGVEGQFVEVDSGMTDKNGKMQFEHLRLAVFDEGYFYYLVETKAPEGYVKSDPIPLHLYESFVKVMNENDKVESVVAIHESGTIGHLLIRESEEMEFAFTKVAAEDYELKLRGAEFELEVLKCTSQSHEHTGDCWKLIDTQVSQPEVKFEKMASGNVYRLKEVKAPEGRICPEGYWIIRTGDKKEIEIEAKGKVPQLKILKDETYVLENKEAMKIPVTGGRGNLGYYMLGIFIIIGGFIMKKSKRSSKFMMMCMAFIMMFQMLSVTAFAINKTEVGKITVNGVEENVTVHAYRLMDINYDYDVQQPKNPMYRWVTEVASWMKTNYPAYIDTENMNAVEEVFSKADASVVAEVYDKLAVAIKAGTVKLSDTAVTAKSETVTIDNLTMGNYFLLAEDGVKVYRPLTANLVPEWKDNVWKMSQPVVDAKATTPSITKTVTNGVKKDNVNIGDVISYELVSVVPDYPENATAKKYMVSDKLCEALTLIEDSVKIYGCNSGKTDTLLETGFARASERFVEEKAVSFALDFDYDVIKGYETVKITYNTILNENAVTGDSGNINHAFLDYNNNPYVSTSWNTDEDKTTVYTYGMKIAKVDEDDGKGLAGAEFSLSRDGEKLQFVGTNGTYRVAKQNESGVTNLKVDGSGALKLDGLDVGTYVLTEEKAPAGYIKLQNPVEVVVADEDIDGKVENGNQELGDGYIPVTVKNDKGFTLPVTGGIGTTVFSITGILLICGSLALMCTNMRRRNSR